MTALKNVIIEFNNYILRVIINREKVLNALNGETISELQHVFDSHRDDERVRCVILTGSGEKSFVAGADITELAKLDVQTGTDFSARGLHLTQTIQNFPSPVIAAVNGFALGGGCELALACDISSKPALR